MGRQTRPGPLNPRASPEALCRSVDDRTLGPRSIKAPVLYYPRRPSGGGLRTQLLRLGLHQKQ